MNTQATRQRTVGSKRQRTKSQATTLVEIARRCELWHTPDQDAYASVMVNKHHEHWPVRSKGFKRWLARQFYVRVGKTSSSQAINDALAAVEGIAIYEGAEHAVHVRLAEDGLDVYLDLCNANWEAVRITPRGWTVTDHPPVRFRRAKAMWPLPLPERETSIDDLRRFLNVTDEDWPLIACWQLAAMRPRGPYPVLCLHGEQGSGKSTDARLLRSLVDPNTAPLRSQPREPRDLMIAANNGWVIALDNLSWLPVWLSDAICRLSTGGGFSTRTLYENDEETIFDAMRPVILNGIEGLATRGDLLDRSLLVSLPTIPEERRCQEKKFWQEFDAARPHIFGALLDAVSSALANEACVRMDSLPRMADFAVWAVAGEEALGLGAGDFMAAYSGNRQEVNELAIEASPAGKALIEFMAGTAFWEGSSADLLKELNDRADDRTRQLKGWPGAPHVLSGILDRLAPNLRRVGIDVERGSRGRDKVKRRIITMKVRESSVPSVPAVPSGEKPGSGGDASRASGDAPGTQAGIDVSPGRARPGTHGDAGDADIQSLSEEVAEWTG